MIIGLGVVMQVIQMIVSIRNRNKARDLTGDPWNGRTLEWSVASPAPEYNFAVIPRVYGRDAWWAQKHSTTVESVAHYEDIVLPKNSAIGIAISAAAFVAGFGIVWHMYWLVPVGVLGVVVALAVRLFDEETEYVVPAAEVARIEGKRHH